MDYLKLAQDHASMWSIDRNGKLEFTFDEIGLEYFLDSLDIDFLAEPKKEWVGLTDKEVKQLSDYCVDVRDEIEFIRAIEEEIKEKNNG